ncbi:uncharacterized protein LOC121382174 [Gigantopelta aegis]|uniref:uncharacterized protein LOC121382174 n=1 Tax=Gigantopelta aegis TaxID=1735272 RepID=UPI001B88CC2F|nr:uncharacterized protein LOC121382174 [Gigantopelta aegis]XP_041367622.1 uncharacterized protein LOC121382174 [Gigantopelta aegis]XP_041367623.1 uncharacterized protein LOC121382174 [Gigantopelta aegis]XP_041367624.1 uncharacterized protein LOC121382174 [Gigantopelta aegis]XP_041367625.1 uncharacterized protein LOC121382174 [Gigantopelta aegis]XP_041367626.1 uncharacterized protein LOC121382174 [Gigantopelta aegis]XP_041367628.1 uncharacterized protein LOC121382174 [Gigantopelta aegis]XP_0
MFTCTRREAFLSVFFLLLTFFVFMATYHRDTIQDNITPLKYLIPAQSSSFSNTRESCVGEQKLHQDRIRLSRMLNSMKHNFSRQSCEMLEVRKKSGEKVNVGVSASGGWCRTASSSTGGNHIHDRPLAEDLSKFFEGKAVASFGDGPGDYKKYIDSTKRLRLYDAYDGAPYCKETSGGVVEFLDLTAPQYGLPLYDWIMSLEVAEHIPSMYEGIYIDNIARHAKEGIVLSWAVPGQGGLSHVNNRPLDYVKKVLYEKGFAHDPESSKRLQTVATLGWLRANTNVYRRLPSSPANPRDA